MKAIVSYLSFLLMLIVLFSCSKEMTEKEHFDKAQAYMEQQNWMEAEKAFDSLNSKFPNGTFAAKSLFMVGYINANHLNNLDKARQYYGKFLETYPDHDLADDAQYEIDHLGRDIESLPFLVDDAQEEESGEEKDSGTNSPN